MSIRVLRKRADSYQHGNLRQAMIQAGLKLLGEGGEAALSLRAAAQLAGVSHAAPYRHFRDKDALIAAIAEEGFRLLTRRMRQEIDAARPDDLLARLRAAGRGYVAFAVEHPAHFRTIFGGFVCKGGAPASLREAGDEAYQVLRSLVVEGIAGGCLRPGDPDEVSLAAWSQVHGLAMLIIERQVPGMSDDPAAAARLTDAMSGYFESGLRAPQQALGRR